MKKIISIAIIAGILLPAISIAQNKVDKAAHGVKKGSTKAWQGTKKGATKAWQGTKKGAKKAGNETAEQATTVKAKVIDKKSSEWVGPEGQTIYMDGSSKYYWVNGHGKRIYVSQAALKARQKK